MKKKYLKDKTPNDLLDIKFNAQNKMSYNPDQFPEQIQGVKNSLYLDKNMIRNTKFSKNSNNNNNNYDGYGVEENNNNFNNNIIDGGMNEKNDYY